MNDPQSDLDRPAIRRADRGVRRGLHLHPVEPSDGDLDPRLPVPRISDLYLDRGDLAHVQPADLTPTPYKAKPMEPDAPRRLHGFVRNKLTVLDGGAGRTTALAFEPETEGPSPSPDAGCRYPPGAHPRGPHEGLRRRQLRRMRQLYPRPQRHLPQMRYVWGDQQVFLRPALQGCRKIMYRAI